MEKTINDLFESAKKHRRGLLRLKHALVTLGQYDIAADLREVEKKAFPETDETKASREGAKKLKCALGMVGLNVKEETCWLISETMKMYNEKGAEFSIDDAATIGFKHSELYDVEP